ncbi:hypothetical protein BTUL_0029g00830 [Botrytis tulipae]|uniref:Uncharacterized protein n=1 Tax=Botrytis tulipae TaxID=87230 RepID=A0A4Z1F4D9_9HELO|nr:hypothetical protein BTUL_0029g00830 [Botrytis tulipae]
MESFIRGRMWPRGSSAICHWDMGIFERLLYFCLANPMCLELTHEHEEEKKLTAAFSIGLFVLEVDIGIICSCLLSFPAFFRHRKPAKWDSYVSLIMSYVSQTRSLLSADRSSSRRYHLQPDLNSDGGAYRNTKIGGAEDVEAFALSEREGMNIRKTTEITNQSVAIEGYGR